MARQGDLSVLRWEHIRLPIILWPAATYGRYLTATLPADRRDNATFFHDATVDHRDRPKPIYRKAKWRRVARRNALVGVPSFIGGVMIPAQHVQDVLQEWDLVDGLPVLDADWWQIGQGYGVVMAGVGIGFACRWLGRYITRNPKVPTAYAVARNMVPSLPPGRHEARKHLEVYGDTARLWLPPVKLTDPQRDALVSQVGRALGYSNPKLSAESWTGRAFVEFTATVDPRPLVVWPEVARHLDATDGRKLFAGLGPDDVPVFVDLDADSPHIAVTGGSQNGKSVLAGVLAMQVLKTGGLVCVLDAKVNSHAGIKGRPGVHYATSGETIHHTLISLRTEMEARLRRVERGEDPGPAVLVLAEEMNAGTLILKEFWKEYREKDDPAGSPAVAAWIMLCCMGRALRMNIVSVTQDPNWEAFGKAAARTNFGAAFLGRPQRTHWDKLTGVRPKDRPKAHKVTGRYHMVVGDDVLTFQVPFIDPAVVEFHRRQLDDYLAGAPVADTSFLKTAPQSRMVETLDLGEQDVTLTEFAMRSGRDIAALRKAAQREGFPPRTGQRGNAALYSLAALDAKYGVAS